MVCPGGQVQCPGETTCCKLKSGEYGCCPFPQAVCCSDGKHCCPNGYTCDVAAGMCNKGLQILNIFSKKPATKVKIQRHHFSFVSFYFVFLIFVFFVYPITPYRQKFRKNEYKNPLCGKKMLQWLELSSRQNEYL